MSNNALQLYENNGFDLMQRTAKAMAASGFFSDAKQQAQAIVKVMAGAELGLPPFTSMTGIHIIQGKPALGANVIATMIKNDPRYNYKVKTINDGLVELEFFEDGQSAGISSFSIDDAKRAQTKNIGKYPRNMLFARAISNGARWYAPGIFGGAPVYTPDELNAQYDEEGHIIEGEIVEHQQPPVAQYDFIPHQVESVVNVPPAQAQPVTADSLTSLDAYMQGYADGESYNVGSLYSVAEIAPLYKALPHMMNALNGNPKIKARNEAITAKCEEGVAPILTNPTTPLAAETFEELAKWLIERKEG